MTSAKAVESGVSLGANLGDRLAALREARERIASLPETRCMAVSPVYETEPVGVKPEQAHMFFLNAVLICETALDLISWFAHLRAIEQKMGRVRESDRYAPRIIDIDLIYYGRAQFAQNGLVVPHERWHERRFVVQPLADVRPDLIMPGDARAVKDILAALPPRPSVKLLTKAW